MTALQKHLDKNIRGIKEFNAFLSSNPNQLRNPNNKKLYEYFHKNIIRFVDEPYYSSIVKFLSKAYRSKMDADRSIQFLEEAITEAKNATKKDMKHLNIDTDDTEEPTFSAPESPVVSMTTEKSNSPIKSPIPKKPRKNLSKSVKVDTPVSSPKSVSESEEDTKTEPVIVPPKRARKPNNLNKSKK